MNLAFELIAATVIAVALGFDIREFLNPKAPRLAALIFVAAAVIYAVYALARFATYQTVWPALAGVAFALVMSSVAAATCRLADKKAAANRN